METQTQYQHITLDDRTGPIIAGTRMKVIQLVLDSRAYGWSPTELQLQHPQLTLGQIHSALAYYWDHQAELDQEIEDRLRHSHELQQASPPTPLETRLRNQGLI